MAADPDVPVSPDEAAALFHPLAPMPAVLLAVSGGPDSTALMWLAARWRASLASGPKLVAATIDHGLRREAAAEARDVAKLARALGLVHRTLRWTGTKPATGLQEAARLARYRLLADAAGKAGAAVIVTAHTRDDQAETVLFRMARGSGIAGLAGMRGLAPLPDGRDHPVVARPLLGLPKSRLIATLAAENIPFAQDPSNLDPRFTRPRLRGLMPALAGEGLTAERLAQLAVRLARADAALVAAADAADANLARRDGNGRIVLQSSAFMALSEEIGLRLLCRAAAEMGDEGPVELGKAEQLNAALVAAYRSGDARFRRSLAGALVTLTKVQLTIERAPPRRSRTLTTGRGAAGKRAKRR